MLESISKNAFSYQKLSEEECKSRGILGRLVGKIADIRNATRNGRKYSETLWEKVFSNPVVKEKIDNRCLFGELGHPTDRTEVDMEKVALCLAEQPKKGKDGFLYGVFDILSTPNGKILKALCDYGCNIGISSRGQGDVETDFDGGEDVVPDTYDFECFDAVLVPAVKEARLEYVTESLNKKSLAESLNTLIENSADEDKKIMTETLNSLKIDYSQKSANVDIDADSKPAEAENNGSKIVEDLQVALKEKMELESKITELQEKLSVCYAKEAKQEELISRSTKAIKTLSETAKLTESLKSRVDSLEQQVKEKERTISEKETLTESLRSEIKERTNESRKAKVALEEAREEIRKAKTSVRNLKEGFDSQSVSLKEENKRLQENLGELKKDMSIKASEYTSKLSKANQLVEKYKTIASKAIDKYIDSKAVMIGVESSDIKRRLPESYSFNDVDSVCESLMEYSVTAKSLPFAPELRKAKVTITESQKPAIPANSGEFDDDVDDSLYRLAGIK